MTYQLNFNGRRFPLIVDRVDYMRGSDWTHSLCVRVPEDIATEIGDFEAECIHYALIDGWTCSGTLNDDDIVWSIEKQGQPIDRDQLEIELNGAHHAD